MPMKTLLRILHLEDDPSEAYLIRLTLETEGIPCVIEHVQNREDFAAALERGNIDFILSDYSMPGFDGMAALKMTREKSPDLPFILISGTMGEEFAIESLKSGATDYVLKQRHSRLIPAMLRAMGEVEERVARRVLEQQFVQAQKMEVVGQLATGIAHDFNNLLGIIIGNNDYMMGKFQADDPLRKNGEEIQLATERAAAVTRQLLVFSRSQVVQPVVLDLNEVIQEMDRMLYRLIDKRIEMAVHLEKRIGRIKADSGYLGQLLMNLVINARDAMPEGGHLTIETGNITLGKEHGRIHPDVEPGEYVLLSVGDTGIGMTDEVKAHLFEAFFTTKPKGKGTGLGLATCLTIVKQSNGHIIVESEPGHGAIFKVYFPRIGHVSDLPIRHRPSTALSRGTETVLVVEDEAALRSMTSFVLESQGYTVLQASGGEEGLRMAVEHRGDPISLVLTDLVMPQMDGRAMAEKLKTISPELKILFTSGWAADTVPLPEISGPEIAFLPKPYTLSALTAKIREVLERNPAPVPVARCSSPAAKAEDRFPR
jgi:two-component system cell cycle sensor histidine kinase/response regulator CckA